ncbi:MAG TPA: CHAT domain-containing protein [Pyrinomonadaceae bacterium]|nr:CHAT domain-containing protein [Pyrinomonadaceae bacterium]
MPERKIVLVEYFVSGDDALIFGVRADFPEPQLVIRKLDYDEMRRTVVMNFGAHNQALDLFRETPELWHRYDDLIAPVADWAAPDDIVYLVPHGLLHYLPLHALKICGQYLIERNPVIYSPSASLLRYCQSRRKNDPDGKPSRRTAAVFGNSRWNIPKRNLPASEEEAKEVAELFGARPLLRNEVTMEAFRQAIVNVDVVHFAGHAGFDEEAPLESGLEMAGTERLTAREVFSLTGLRAHLVTLSGCETGVNQHHPGDELIGLTRSFLYAETPSVIVSLWRVADKSTAFLMKTFYNHLRGRASGFKIDALRQAMLETKRQSGWDSPYYWAPFALLGDWQ